jgi:hypothetical protein
MMLDKIVKWLETDKHARWLVTSLYHLSRERFYGKATTSFESGNIVLLRKEQTVKPPRDR